MRFTFLVVMLPLAACAAAPPDIIPTPAPRFSAIAFFEGHTEGDGVLKTMLSPRRVVHVHGLGRVDPDGTLILDQRIDEQGKPIKRGEWHIREAGAERYAGTGTDAAGPIVGDVAGNRLHLRFHTTGGLDAEQWLDLSPGGRSARNHMTVRKLGMVVARLDETIRKTS